MEAVREEAEALAEQQEHPLLGPLPSDAVVSPSMPFRVFMPTKVLRVNYPKPYNLQSYDATPLRAPHCRCIKVGTPAKVG